MFCSLCQPQWRNISRAHPDPDHRRTNGAGDAHTGALAALLAQGVPMDRALLLANCAGALSTTVVGPASCPTREDIEAAADALSESGN